ncbi:MAG: shikimate dehydrogenase, partial [Candidatus Omnitrophica bacterium]|nr:shikimate dehydrogenase [Candidatus Omnitrophota bacterium]
HADMFVYDLIYNPQKTLLLKMAEENKAKSANGLGMLYFQGILAFEHWAQGELPIRVKKEMRKALEEGLNRK